ncbi:MAG: hypothetical protein DDT36_00911 [Firmicutes bacterium]|nr:hypothetical protein [Bacillota bacterium]
MILQGLKEYYDRKATDQQENAIAPFGWEHKEVPFIVVLDQEGNLVQIQDTREGAGKDKRAKTFLVPEAVKRASNISANLLWDVAPYVFGAMAVADKGDVGAAERAERCQADFIRRMKAELTGLPVVQTILTFLGSIDEDRLAQEDCWLEICEKKPNLAFLIAGDLALVCRRPEVVARNNQNLLQTQNGHKAVCLVTGQPGLIKTLHRAIKGVNGAQSSGANIVSFNLEAFESFGKKQGLNAPVGSEAEFAYTTALNTLLQRDSKQRLTIGDASTVFWSATASQFESDFADLFAEVPKDQLEAQSSKVRALFQSVESGAYLNDPSQSWFYVLGLSPNAGRISVRFWQVARIIDMATRIKQYFDDFAIVKPPSEPEYYSLWRILVNVATQDKSENIPPNLAGDFMRSILEGRPFPATLLQAVLRRIKSDVEHRVKPVRAALLKAYLNRYHRFYPSLEQREVSMTLDINQPSMGYQLGRLFAVLERIQGEAYGDLNAPIRERFYGAASTTPVTVFSRLMRLKQHHLAKLGRKGREVYFERLIGEVVGKISDFPAFLDLHEQGRFAIGYYHQRQDFYTKKDSGEGGTALASDSTTEDENERV